MSFLKKRWKNNNKKQKKNMKNILTLKLNFKINKATRSRAMWRLKHRVKLGKWKLNVTGKSSQLKSCPGGKNSVKAASMRHNTWTNRFVKKERRNTSFVHCNCKKKVENSEKNNKKYFKKFSIFSLILCFSLSWFSPPLSRRFGH